MSLLPTQYLKSTVYLTKDDKNFGTGFLIGIKSGDMNKEQQPLYYIFLVTNRHNILDGKNLKIRFNKKDGTGIGEENLSIKDSDWIYHNNITDTKNELYTDVVMLKINFDYINSAGYETYFIDEDNMIIDKESFDNLKVGEEIYLLGFPLGINGLNSNFPIARQGIIARNDNELLEKREIYLDINNFPGNSGGPIILKPNSDALEGEKPILKSKLIGVIKSYYPYNKTYYDISTTPPTATVMISENSGLAQGIPSYILYEMGKEYIEKLKQNTLFEIQKQ